MDDIRRYERANTVPAERQVRELIIRSEDEGRPRILFVGNSITLHGVKPEIGWHWLWGMAASDKEKDYVHQTMRMVHEVCPQAGYMLAQASPWELEYWRGVETLGDMRELIDWNADIVVIRFGENIREQHLAQHALQPRFEELIDHFSRGGRAKVIVTSLFWPNPAKDAAIETAARKCGAAYVDIRPLGMRDDMKALGLFEHEGVAAHPGDLGMLRIAEAIFDTMKPMLKGE